MQTQTFVHQFLTATVSEDSIQAAKWALFDYLTVTLGVPNHESALILQAFPEASQGNSLLIGQGRLATPSLSALFNGFRAHFLDMDDTHSNVRGHPSAVLFSALLTEMAHYSGKEILSAYVIGLEIMARLGLAVSPVSYLKGWHNTSILGGIAATGALAYLKKWDEEKTLNSMSIAVSQAAGLQLQFGTPTKPLHVGLAAKQAVESSALAAAGMQASKNFLFDTRGFLAMYTTQKNETVLLENWGSSWQLVHPGIWLKKYPFCSAAMAGADAAVALYQQYNFSSEDIQKVEISFFTGRDQALKYRQPTTGEQGRFSIEYIVWLGLTGQAFSQEAFSSQPIPHQTQQELRKISRGYLEEVTAPYTNVSVYLKSGQRVSRKIAFPEGSPQNPLSFKERLIKFDTYVKSPQAENLAQTVLNFEKQSGKQLFSLLQTVKGGQ